MPRVHLFTFRMGLFLLQLARAKVVWRCLCSLFCRITSSLAILFIGKDADIERCE